MLTLRLGGRALEVEPAAVRFDGVSLAVGPTPARLLFYLASNPGRIVPTDELLREVWDGAHVTPSSVQQAVRTLRVALDGDGDALIHTVRGQGYRLGALVEVSEARWARDELPLVGRAHQLGRLSEAVEAARSARGQLVLVAGGPGLGKTRLLQELEALAPRRGFAFLCGRCPEQSGAAALWPWEEILRGALAADPQALHVVAPSDLALLRRTFPVLGAEADASPAPDPGSARFRLYEAVRRVLVACAQARPLVVAIDDLHSADETSVRLLEWVAARNAGERIVLLAAYREVPAQQDRVLRAAVAGLLRLPGASLERLQGLTREEVEEAVRAALGNEVSAEDVDELWRRSAGNPFFLKTLVHQLRPGGTRATLGTLFPEVNEAVRQHVSEVSPATQELLRLASVLGREVDAERLRLLAGATREQVAKALAEARAAGLVEPGPHTVLRFVHALVAEALHDSFDAGARTALHARASQILEDEGREDASSIGALAEHAWQAAARIGAARAAAHCERAAEAALARYAFEEAARMYERALALSDEAELGRRLALLLALGESSAFAGRVEAASETLARAIELAKETGDHAAHARAVLALAVMRQDDVRDVDGRWLETLEAAIDAHRAETPLRAELLSRLAGAVWPVPPRERARALASESVRLVRQSDDADAQASVLTRAYRILQTGPGDDATRAEIARGLEAALERTRNPIIALNARLMLLLEALQVGDPRAFAREAGRMVEQAEAVGAPQAEWYALVARASRAHLLGQLDRAEELADRGLVVGESIGLKTARWNHSLQLLSIRWDQGRLAELEGVFEAATDVPLHHLSVRLSWGLACLEAGRSGPARETLREFCLDPSRAELDSAWCPTAYLLAEVAVQLDDAEAAAIVLPRVAALRGRHAQVALGFCHWGAMERQIGRLLALLDRFDEAEAELEAGLARDRRFGALAAVARGQHDLGALLLRRGRLADRERARTLLAEALALGEHIGMAGVGKACRRLLLGERRDGQVSLRPEQARRAERRQLTVLSCVVESARPAAGTEPAGMQRCHERVAEVLEHFGGHVARSAGDGLLACFGWPRAHEDDAERAVRAGLAIVEAVRANAAAPAPSLRIGIHTGPVVSGGGEGRETLAASDAAKLAARLAWMAESDAVMLSAATLRRVSGIFVTRERGEHALEGSAEPVRVHQAVAVSGVRSRLDVAAATELTPFVGRDQELMLLDDRFAQAGEGRGQAVLIRGEPGIGKSRLVQAFRERIAERAHTWLECRGSANTQDSAFFPVLELQRQGLGFGFDDAVEVKLARIAASLRAVGFDPEETVPVVAALHGIPHGARSRASDLSPEGLRKQTFALLTEWLLRLGERQPLVLVLEDLHWMDPSTIELIGRVLEQVPTAPLLLLATHRPEFEPPWQARSFVTPMLLSRLPRAQLASLVHEVARGRALPEAWVEEILRRADGVPLFAEELTRALLEAPDVPEDGALPLQIPVTLQDSLNARLDALGPAKDLAQVASVLGREFSHALLLEVAPLDEGELQAALRSALRAELFYQRGSPPEATYLFKHALIRDAAYQSMSDTTRRRHHRRAAETLIERMPEVAETQPELVAQHWSEAGETETAIMWWLRAGERASDRADCGEGEACARRGLSLVGQLRGDGARRERELRLQTLLGTVLQAKSGGAHPATMAVWQRARVLSQGESDLSGAALIRYHLSSGHMSAGNYAEALTLAAELREIQERLRHPVFEVACHQVRSLPLLYLGRLPESLAGLDAACAVDADPFQTHQLGVEQPALLRWGFAAWAQWLAGFPDRSRESAERGRDHARRFGNSYGLCYLSSWSSVAALFRRDWSEARRLGLEASQLASKQGYTMLAAVGGFAEATAAVKLDGEAAALERYAQAVAQAGSTGNRCASTAILGNLADVLLTLGRPDEAARQLKGALALSHAIDERFYLAELLRLQGEIALRGAGHGRRTAEAAFREAIEVARGQAAKALELRAATSLARLWREQGRRDAARELLSPIYGWFTEGFGTADLIEAKALLEEFAI